MNGAAENMNIVCYIGASVLVVPFVGGILDGIGVKVSSLLQKKRGAPVTQPFFDFIKIIMKQKIRIINIQPVFCIASLLFSIAAFVHAISGRDLTGIVFMMMLADILFISGLLYMPSLYGRKAAKREIPAMVLFALMMIGVSAGIYSATGSFMIQVLMETETKIGFKFPVLVVPLFICILFKLRKSPVDLSVSSSGHKELAGGMTVDFCGTDLLILKMSEWYQIFTLFIISALLFSSDIFVSVCIGLILYVLAIVTDNITCRMTWQWMYIHMMPAIVLLGLINIFWIYI